MSEHDLNQETTVRTAVHELAGRLYATGIPAEIILSTITGWAAAQAVQVVGPDETARCLRHCAGQVEAAAMPVAGHA